MKAFRSDLPSGVEARFLSTPTGHAASQQLRTGGSSVMEFHLEGGSPLFAGTRYDSFNENFLPTVPDHLLWYTGEDYRTVRWKLENLQPPSPYYIFYPSFDGSRIRIYVSSSWVPSFWGTQWGNLMKKKWTMYLLLQLQVAFEPLLSWHFTSSTINWERVASYARRYKSIVIAINKAIRVAMNEPLDRADDSLSWLSYFPSSYINSICVMREKIVIAEKNISFHFH